MYAECVAWWNRKPRERSLVSISDPALAEFFGLNRSFAGVSVSETTALSLSAVWRAVSLISGTIASLPMRTLRDTSDGSRQRVPSFLDEPAGPDGVTRYEWVELVLVHLLIHGNAFLLHLYNGGGGLVGLLPIHPLQVSVELAPVPGGKRFRVTLDDGTVRDLTSEDLTHIPAMGVDGCRGLSPISVARNSLGTAVQGDRAAARAFANGFMVSGIVTPEEEVTEAEARQIKEGLREKVTGTENAGDIAVINRKLKFTQWSMSAEDAQFLESRQFQIEEIARWYGIPPFALMQTDKQTSWGQGIEAQQRGLARQVLGPWATRIEQRLSRRLPRGQFCEFDFSGLERGTPESEISLLIQQVGAGLLTVNEARAIRNLDPVPGGDALRVPGAAEPAPEPAPELPEVAQ